jgi:hypothetical protein
MGENFQQDVNGYRSSFFDAVWAAGWFGKQPAALSTHNRFLNLQFIRQNINDIPGRTVQKSAEGF